MQHNNQYFTTVTNYYLCRKFYFARTGWLTIALLPTPIAFFLLASSDSAVVLHVGTALVGLSSGFIFAAAVSITSELFGPNSVGVNHNILITNIPVGSLVYGCLAALVYDANISFGLGNILMSDIAVCMGRQCYFLTFLLWGCISVLGLVCSMLLFFRTRHAYDLFEQNRISQLYQWVVVRFKQRVGEALTRTDMSIVYYCLGSSTNEEGFLVFTKFWRERERCSEHRFCQ